MSYKFKINCLKSSVTALLLLLLQAVNAQLNSNNLDLEVASRQKLFGSDAVFMLWKGDSLVFKKEMGDFNSKTVAPIASSSKWLTTVLVLQLVDEGRISLDDKVARYLPAFESYNKNYITIRHCLSNYTGIKDETTVAKIFGGRKYKSLEDEVNAFAAREIRTNPGVDFSYGNIGINIAGRILEVVTKKKFEVLIKQKLLAPLGMRKTSFAVPDLSASVNPAAGAVSTADDYMNFLVMLLNKGTFKGQQILSAKSIQELLRVHTQPAQITYAPKAATGFAYGLGCWIIDQKTNNGMAIGTVAACPGLFGSWPMIDYCRGYAYLVITKSLTGEEKSEAHLSLKKYIDQQIPSSCK